MESTTLPPNRRPGAGSGKVSSQQPGAAYTPGMIVEIEAKIRLTEPQSLHDKLKELDATLDRQVRETNTYFDLADGELKSSDQGLRIRVEQDRASGKTHTVITHKGPRAHGKFKSRSETELGVQDARGAAQLLAVLGYQSVLTFEKDRTRYLIDGCRVEIDTLPHLGTFVEIEGDSEEAVEAVRHKVGLGDQPLIRASYIAMLTTYLQENHISQTVIKLEPSKKASDA